MRDTHTRQPVLMCMRLLTMWLYEANRKEEGNVYYHQFICAMYVVFPNILVVKMFILCNHKQRVRVDKLSVLLQRAKYTFVSPACRS